MRYFTIQRYIAIAMATVLLLGYGNAMAKDREGPKYISFKTLISNNRTNINTLSPGMTKQEVISLMGSTPSKTKNGDVPNPYTAEFFESNKGLYEVLYYLTRKYGRFRSIDKTKHSTPVIFRDGKLVGIGWNMVDKVLEQSFGVSKK